MLPPVTIIIFIITQSHTYMERFQIFCFEPDIFNSSFFFLNSQFLLLMIPECFEVYDVFLEKRAMILVSAIAISTGNTLL